MRRDCGYREVDARVPLSIQEFPASTIVKNRAVVLKTIKSEK